MYFLRTLLIIKYLVRAKATTFNQALLPRVGVATEKKAEFVSADDDIFFKLHFHLKATGKRHMVLMSLLNTSCSVRTTQPSLHQPCCKNY